jgi:glycosyltransferase involved in cell wall biosynthesis
MRVLFVHQNFPGQYRHLAPGLARQSDVEVVAMGETPCRVPETMRYIAYGAPAGPGRQTHPYLRGFEGQVRRGQTVLRAAMELRRDGFVPDLVCAHPGWGDTMFFRELFPEARTLSYFEFFYHAEGADVGFDPEFPASFDQKCRLHVRNAPHLMALEACDAGICPTDWQRRQFPAAYRDKLVLQHDGIDTDTAAPAPAAAQAAETGAESGAETAVDLGPAGPRLTRADEVITYVARNLEPYRGFHVVMRALPELLRRRPRAQVVLVGGDEVSYGRRPEAGGSWRAAMLAELGDALDLSRVHFVGRVPYGQFLRILQVSRLHLYLTYPFVLSWSLMEAMAVQCPILASDTPPVAEMIRDGETGRLVDFFDRAGLVDTAVELLADPDRAQALGRAARAHIVRHYDLKRICLPRQIELARATAEGRAPVLPPT